MRTYNCCNIDLLSFQADNGSSSKYSCKIDKNKENQKQKKRAHIFQTWKKQLFESDGLRLIDLKKYITKNNHIIHNNINENSNNKKQTSLHYNNTCNNNIDSNNSNHNNIDNNSNN